ncbi:hypothetical protein [Halorubrum amylolyticum]|uniref:hypothetical protein n=1 Tax=Halorubrum amylolyticum TaxID=2508724 RepID=UPI0010088425|nr:hypothetical protein [Halorubrum amylolyticum]
MTNRQISGLSGGAACRTVESPTTEAARGTTSVAARGTTSVAACGTTSVAARGTALEVSVR